MRVKNKHKSSSKILVTALILILILSLIFINIKIISTKLYPINKANLLHTKGEEESKANSNKIYKSLLIKNYIKVKEEIFYGIFFMIVKRKRKDNEKEIFFSSNFYHIFMTPL